MLPEYSASPETYNDIADELLRQIIRLRAVHGINDETAKLFAKAHSAIVTMQNELDRFIDNYCDYCAEKRNAK